MAATIVLPIPSPTVRSIGGGSAVMKLVGTYTNSNLYPEDSDKRTDQQCWKFVASPANGSKFDRMEVSIQAFDGVNTVTFSKIVRELEYKSYWFLDEGDAGSYWYDENEAQNWDTDPRFFLATAAGGNLTFPAWGITSPPDAGFRVMSFDVIAHFVKCGLIYEPGDGRLIYDITTGRPMCYD